MQTRQYEIWIADLNPQIGTEPGKTRPVVVVQTDMLNQHGHPSTLICPLTTQVHSSATLLRVHVAASTDGLEQDSDIMIDQLRAIDNKRLIRKISTLNTEQIEAVRQNLKVILDLI